MYFNDLLPPEADVAAYKATLTQFSKLVEDSVRLLGRSTTVAEKAAASDGKRHHISVFALSRHVCEQIDGVAVLALEGCAVPCQPTMRSAMEAYLGVRYILESDSERRAWAYQVAHAHRRIKLYRSLDPQDPSGKQTRAMIGNDPIASGMQLPQADWQKLIANLEKLLQKPECVGVEAEWQRLKQKNNGKDPHWYSLFGGPLNIRSLAERLNGLAQYDFCYRQMVEPGSCRGLPGKLRRRERWKSEHPTPSQPRRLTGRCRPFDWLLPCNCQTLARSLWNTGRHAELSTRLYVEYQASL